MRVLWVELMAKTQQFHTPVDKNFAYLPHKNDPQLGPRFIIMYAETSTFSPPRSPRTRHGVPYLAVANRNSSRTVLARLLVLARRAVTWGEMLNVRHEGWNGTKYDQPYGSSHQ